jgi:hypothetical protein
MTTTTGGGELGSIGVAYVQLLKETLPPFPFFLRYDPILRPFLESKIAIYAANGLMLSGFEA